MTKVQCSYTKYSLCLGEGWRQERGRHKSPRHREEKIMRKAGIYNIFFRLQGHLHLTHNRSVKHSDQLELGGWEVEFLFGSFPFNEKCYSISLAET